MAEGLRRQSGVFFIDDFLGGVNSYFPANKVGDNFLTEGQNVRLKENGTLTRRHGLTKLGTRSTGSDINVVPIDIRAVGSNTDSAVFTIHADEPLGDDTGVWTWELWGYDGTSWSVGDTLLGNFSLTPEHSAESSWVRESDGTEYLYTAIPTDDATFSFYKWALIKVGGEYVGTAIGDTNTDPPRNARYLLNAFNRLWAGGITTNVDQNTWYFSDVGKNKEVWNRTVNFAQIDTTTGQNMTGLASYRDNSILLGFDSSIWLFSIGGAAIQLDGTLSLVSNDFGLGSNKSIANVGEDVIFMDQYGDVRSVNQSLQGGGLIRSAPLSLPIKDETDAIDPNEIYRTSAAFFNGEYWITFLNTSGEWRTFSYNLLLQRWTGPQKFKNSAGRDITVRGMTVGYGSLGVTDVGTRGTHLYFLTHDSGASAGQEVQVYEYDDSKTTDDGTAIDMVATTKLLDFGAPEARKKVRWVRVQFAGKTGTTGTFTVEGRVDFGAWSLLGEAVEYINKDEVAEVHLPATRLERGKLFQFRIKTSDVNSQLEIIRLFADVVGVENKDF